ncbi:hypothetical protein QBC46DRAFT_369823 [Diplogelasinospora grovesii]|uniref:Uncharacterized protein n=1 Tax=Diplogelasinospora grovesii TaxID=303347 RepID=A0AAN6NII4_9PEZI|nr:hypothetical protein QBC46DRAFT_369823 [Diplogelasinospora grovesii]
MTRAAVGGWGVASLAGQGGSGFLALLGLAISWLDLWDKHDVHGISQGLDVRSFSHHHPSHHHDHHENTCERILQTWMQFQSVQHGKLPHGLFCSGDTRAGKLAASVPLVSLPTLRGSISCRVQTYGQTEPWVLAVRTRDGLVNADR